MKIYRSKFLAFFAVLSLIILTNCGDDDPVDCTGQNFFTQFGSEFDDVTSAALAYANNQSESNCDALKNAYQNLLDALRPYEDCAMNSQDREAFLDALDEAETELDDLVC